MKFRIAAVLAVMFAGAVLVAPASADEEIDCSSTPFVFSGDGYLVDCARYEANARKDGASGQSQSA